MNPYLKMAYLEGIKKAETEFKQEMQTELKKRLGKPNTVGWKEQPQTPGHLSDRPK